MKLKYCEMKTNFVIKYCSLISFTIFVFGALLIACSSDSETIYGDICYEGHCDIALHTVSIAVACVMADPVVPIEDLSNDPRIDWANCASSQNEATSNMTGYILNGEKPLIALSSSPGDVNPISYYLYKEAEITKYKYWLKESSGVICMIHEDGQIWCSDRSEPYDALP